MSSKRKHDINSRVEITSTQNTGALDAPAAPSGRTVTFSTRQLTSRRVPHTDTANVSLSKEDLVILQRHPEYELPTNSFLDFEQAVQDDLAVTQVPEIVQKPKTRVSAQ